ncbi:uncharacterized protein LOC120979063 isoform X2 [Bufo bufo]|uniref:uncharacterized protein LOC120979063 isoform X2 n=1 Tax=Bufo bufo TaxID=8384 RepID=UPI001ABE8BCF|nr:uncharacterized protein LOC120979063 isoform X2 [Bufo bufo]
MFWKCTVDSLDDDPEESDVGGSDTPAVFSPESSPTHTQAEETEQPTVAPPTLSQGTMETTQQPHPRRRRSVPQASSGQDTREQIDSRVIEFLAKRRSEGPEEAMVRGLGPLLRGVPAHRFSPCVAGLAMIIKLFSSPYEEDIVAEIYNVRCNILAARSHQASMPSQPQPQHHGPPVPGPSYQVAQETSRQPSHFYPQAATYATAPQQQPQVRPGSSFQPGPFTRDLFEL